MHSGIATGKLHQIGEQSVDRCRFAVAVLIQHEPLDAFDHLTRAQRLLVELGKCCAQPIRVHFATIEQRQARLSVHRDRGQRLVDLMGDAGGHFSHGRQAPDVCQAFALLTRLLLGRMALREVANDPGETKPPIDVDLAHRQVDRKETAEAIDGIQLAADADDLLLPRILIALQIVVMIGPMGLRHQPVDRLAEQLRLRITEHPLRGLVEAGDATGRVDHHDRVDRGIQYGLRFRFGAPLIGNVDGRSQHPDVRAICIQRDLGGDPVPANPVRSGLHGVQNVRQPAKTISQPGIACHGFHGSKRLCPEPALGATQAAPRCIGIANVTIVRRHEHRKRKVFNGWR